jgi:hypothetical protein
MSMVRQFLSTYTVRVRKFHAREDLTFEQAVADPDVGDIFEIVREFLAALEKEDVIDAKEKTSIAATRVKDEPVNRHIYGMIESGPYGEPGNLKNTRTRVNRPITEDDAAAYPYYFNFYLPKVGSRGLLAVHNRGKYGCKTPLQRALKEFLETNYPCVRIYLHPFEVDFQKDKNFRFFKKDLQVKRVRAVTWKKLRTQDALIRGTQSEERQIVVEREVHVGRTLSSLYDASALSSVAEAAKATKRVFKQYAELPHEDEKTKYQITIKARGQEKTMTLEQTLDLHLSFDLTSDLLSYTRNVATLNKLHDVCAQYIDHAKSELG